MKESYVCPFCGSEVEVTENKTHKCPCSVTEHTTQPAWIQKIEEREGGKGITVNLRPLSDLPESFRINNAYNEPVSTRTRLAKARLEIEMLSRFKELWDDSQEMVRLFTQTRPIPNYPSGTHITDQPSDNCTI